MEQHFWIDGRDNKKMSVMVHLPTKDSNQTAPVLLFAHGFTGDKIGGNRMGVKIARHLSNEGYIVVRFDFIGSGESQGEFAQDTTFSGWLEDVRTVVNWTSQIEQVDPKRLGVIGHSLGGALVTYLASIDTRIKAACALAPVSYLEQNFRQTIIGPTLWEKSIQGEVIENFYGKKFSLFPIFALDLVQYDIQAAASQITQPFLIIHGKQDQAVPVENSYDLVNSIPIQEKSLLVYDQEEHLFTEKIYPNVVKWFHKHL
ncbi:alpha/beta fold hydrolase [Fictibacillus sp. WQ 8-8]|uniref:alpha/beta hydrolase n=1 Tax=Fictibacillus sp. WQ 8-8 TaxID=2938788 RepID=UPI00210AE51D|nr:alpha/beta fold hydrolase [Fictibacillus sp. WQ 8-8]MCQ6267932.1 alpha/beta fold hydrolase [Fictibacillus sp. WQ 8-8]